MTDEQRLLEIKRLAERLAHIMAQIRGIQDKLAEIYHEDRGNLQAPWE